MLRLAILALLASVAPGFASSIEEDLTACFLIDAPLARLQCYDFLSDRSDLPSGIGSDGAANAWQVTDTTSSTDNIRRVALFRESLKLDTLDNGSALLALRCKQDTTSVIVAIPGFIVSEDETADIRYSLGESEPVSERWTVSEGRYLFGPEGEKAERLIRRMVRAGDFTIRVPTVDGRDRDYAFALAGLDKHVGLLADACHWAG